jgi:hypothetical protein
MRACVRACVRARARENIYIYIYKIILLVDAIYCYVNVVAQSVFCIRSFFF